MGKSSSGDSSKAMQHIMNLVTQRARKELIHEESYWLVIKSSLHLNSVLHIMSDLKIKNQW